MPSPEKRVPLRVIAENTGLSRMAVSLALRDHPSIPPATRKRVQAAARRLGHRADPVVADLMTRLRTATRVHSEETLAIVTNQRNGRSWEDLPTHRAYHEGALARAAQLGYKTEEFRLHEDGMSEKRLSQILWTRGIEGVLIFPILGDPGVFDMRLEWKRFSAAAIAFSLRSPLLHRSCAHHAYVVMEACRRLRKLGYRRPGLAIEAQQDERTGHHWRAGFLCAQDLESAPDPVPPLITASWSFETFADWFTRHRPDVVLGIDRPLVDWMERCGARVPRDAGYASLDLTPDMGAISGMDQNSRQIGAAAIDLIVAGIRQHERGVPRNPKTVMIEGIWRPGETTRAIRPRKSQ